MDQRARVSFDGSKNMMNTQVETFKQGGKLIWTRENGSCEDVTFKGYPTAPGIKPQGQGNPKAISNAPTTKLAIVIDSKGKEKQVPITQLTPKK